MAIRGGLLSLSVISLIRLTLAQSQAQAPMMMDHGGTVLLLARAESSKVVPAASSAATATGVFLVDSGKRSASYDLTFQGLEHGAPKRISLVTALFLLPVIFCQSSAC